MPEPIDREELRRLHTEATTGPWVRRRAESFTFAARNAIIPLLDALEAAEAERDRYREALETIVSPTFPVHTLRGVQKVARAALEAPDA